MQRTFNKALRKPYFRNGSFGVDINGSILWTPTAISTALWFDADDSSTISMPSGILQWNDKSGNSRNAIQTTVVNRPFLVLNELNGKPVVRFDGTNDSLIYDGTFFANTSYSVHAVVIRRSNAVNNYFIGGSSITSNTNLLIGWASNTTFRSGQVSNDVDYTVSGYASPVASLWGVGLNTSVGRYMFLNGTSVASSGTTTVLSSNPGSRLGNFSFANAFYNGDIAEIVATTSVLSTDNRQRIEGYLSWKWGLVANLPVGHPYKDSPPLNL